MHFESVLDLGVDYGSDGGLGWDTGIARFPSGREHVNQARSHALGAWQLGNRRLDVAEYNTLSDFFHAMRGRAHTFLYKDWNDHKVVLQPLVADGSAETQLIKVYGLAINAWSREIRKPSASTVVIDLDSGGGFAALTAGVDYTLDATTGIVTWIGEAPDAPDQLRWSGEFFVAARFDRDRFDAQFIARSEDSKESLYELGTLGVYEVPDA
jgi:uncharacterized protein (TIGR02217 family)